MKKRSEFVEQVRRLNEMIPVLEQKVREHSRWERSALQAIDEAERHIEALGHRIDVLEAEKKALWSLIEDEINDPQQP